MSKVDEGLVRKCVDQFQVIATKVETSVHNKRSVDQHFYHQELQEAVEHISTYGGSGERRQKRMI